jgi:hypothetical protein
MSHKSLSLFLDPIEKPNKSPLSTMAAASILKASMISTNNRGGKGSSSLRPQELLMKIVGKPLLKTKKRTVEI